MDEPAPPRPGDLLWIGADASVQFAAQPFAFLLLAAHPWSTYDGWCWLDGLHLHDRSGIIQRRSIFVRIAGIRPAPHGQARPEPGPQLEAITRRNADPDQPWRTR